MNKKPKAQAKELTTELIKEVSNLQEQVLLKHTLALLKDFQAILEEEEKHIINAQDSEDAAHKTCQDCRKVLSIILEEFGDEPRIKRLCNSVLA